MTRPSGCCRPKCSAWTVSPLKASISPRCRPTSPLSDIRLAVVVQHHPSRADLLHRLLDRLPADALVVPDPGADGQRNAWRSFRACLEAAPPDATHILVVQDDAIPCEHFAEAAAAALAARSLEVVSFFVAGSPVRSSRSVHYAANRCDRWAELDARDWCPAVALCFPAVNAADLLLWADEQEIPERRTSDDAILGDWVRARGHVVVATVPSLVQHPDDVPSLIGTAHSSGRNPARVAACFVGDYDARLIDWVT